MAQSCNHKWVRDEVHFKRRQCAKCGILGYRRGRETLIRVCFSCRAPATARRWAGTTERFFCVKH